MDGHYAIRIDLEYNRYVLATNAPRGLREEPDASESWSVRIFQTGDDSMDALLGEAKKPWLIDAFDSVVEQLESDGNAIVADVDFGSIRHIGELGATASGVTAGGASTDVSLS